MNAIRTWGHRAWRRAPDGAVSDVIPATPGFLTDFSFVRDASGNHHWITCDGALTIGMRRNDGVIVRARTAEACADPLWLWSDERGTLFYVDRGTLKRVSPAGEVTTLATNLNGRSLAQLHVSEHHGAQGIWTDAHGAVYVANYRGRTVWRVSASGGVARMAATSSLWWGPTGGMVAPNGDLWVLEFSLWTSVRIRRIRPDGGVTVFAARATDRAR